MKPCLYALAASILISAAGCGGSSNTQPSPYNGNYAGNWTSSNGDVGSAQLDILQSGSFTGNTTDTTASISGTLKGSISNAGHMTITVSFTGRPAYTGTGTFIKDGSGDVSGTISSTVGGTTTTAQYQFTPNP